ncbi:hypothetical protein ACN38_g4139 [Penicillium nordicum]|uniref:NmrA-like domain-containing protein n=1 Tax=Penicillium nordicum TaxID=229535 RepID=A0A0M8P759_9EURO|nr:hypothetical protein ACN38_g4139 [Penicillium nordicum]
MSSVIVFGPTGSVASVAALTAREHGAKVFLAMRDTQKQIPGLSTKEEQEGGFERIQADLTNPDSVAAAVKASGAKRAFTYVSFGSADHMRATLTAMKSAGVEFVVFLSSYTIAGEPKDVTPADLIAYIHAQAELSLDEVFGPHNYVALRPGGFVTNLLRFKDGIEAGEVKIWAPGFQFDCITPDDMGRVAGTILVQGPRNDQRKVYLYGPQLIAQGDAVVAIGKIIGKDVKITIIDEEEEALDQYLEHAPSKPFAEYMVQKFASTSNELTNRACYKTGVENVKLYTGKPSMKFEDWVEANKGIFSV